MREIKFRYKFKNYKTHEEITSILKISNIENQNLNPKVFDFLEWEILSRDQFIDAKDKNDKEIYENDKVITDEQGWIGTVVFGAGMFYCKDDCGGFSSLCNWGDFEIIENK
jgi:hypothetical protein